MTRETIIEAHTIVRSDVRRVEIARCRREVGGRGHLSVTFAEVRGDRRFQVSIPTSAIDAAIEALLTIRASVVEELGPGSTQYRGAPMHGTWSPDDGASRVRRSK